MATIKDSQVHSILEKLVQNNRRAYFGLQDLQIEGQFKWTDETSLGSYTSWGPGQPTMSFEDKNEDCVIMEIGGNWNDISCDTVLNFICQYGGREAGRKLQ